MQNNPIVKTDANVVMNMMSNLDQVQKIAGSQDITEEQAKEIWRLADQVHQALGEGIDAMDLANAAGE
jgi:ribonuclease PH